MNGWIFRLTNEFKASTTETAYFLTLTYTDENLPVTEDGEETGALRGVADRIAGAIRESGSGMEEADPAVKAMNEVARPMARGYELLTGGSREKRQEGWLRRIWTSLTGFRKDETTFNKAANKSLKNIEEKPDDGKSGSSLGDLLPRIPLPKIPLPKIPLPNIPLPKIPGMDGLAKAVGALLGGAGKAVMGAGRGLLGLGRRL
jgi:hypothetical protein